MARIYPPSFVRSPEGDVYVVRGDRNVQRWDGLVSAFVDSGVPAPSAAVTVGSSTSGTIVGRIYAYCRFLDARGNVSSLSPVSTLHTIAISTKTVTGATNASPIVITSVAHGLSNDDTVKIEGVLGNYAANGTWVIKNKTADTFELYQSTGSGAYSSGGTIYKGAGQIDYTNIPTTSDTRVASKQILRNKDGDTTVFYIDKTLTNLATTSSSSTSTDAQLTDAVALVDTTGRDLNVSTHAEPPNWKRWAAFHKGRLWLAGQLTYREGGISVTNGSPTVTGLGTNWTSAMAGWELYPLGTSNTISYTVSTINTGTQTITLDANYGGSTEAFLHYALVPPILNTNGGAESRTIYFSAAGVPESFTLARSLTLEEQGQGEITGLIPLDNALYVACERALYRIIYSVRPEADAVVRSVARRGLPNNSCWVPFDRVVFCLDQRGVWAFDGNSVEDVSEAVRGVFDGTGERHINWNYTEYFHACPFPDQSVIKWFVVMDGGHYPRHALCYSLRSKRWWIEEYPQPVLASCVGEIGGSQTPLVSLPSRRVGAAITASADGIPGNSTTTLRGTATAGAILSLTDSTAAFTSDVVGAPLRIVEGTGKGQERIVISQTATVLTVDRPWMTLPDTTSVYQIGGVHWQWRCGSLRWTPSPTHKRQSAELIWGTTQNTHALALKRYVSHSATPETFSVDQSANAVRTVDGDPEAWITTTDTNGFARQEYSDVQPDQVHGRETVQLELEGTTNRERLRVYEVSTEGATR